MEHVAELPVKLDLLLKALSMSRVGLAQKLGVDKSLVGRWLAGTVHPGEHNLARLAGIVADKLPGFRLADLFGSTAELAGRLGIEPPRPAKDIVLGEGSPLAAFLEAARPELVFRGAAYEGFWRTSRPSVLVSEKLFHDYAMIRKSADGLLEITIKGSGLEFNGWVFPIAGNLFIFLFDRTGRTPMMLLWKGVSLPRAMVLDGLLMMAALDANRTPVALPIVAERVADLTGEEGGDALRFEQIVEGSEQPEPGLSDSELEARLLRDTGPAAAAAGGAMFLMVDGLHSLSRGAAGGGLEG